MTFVGDRDVEQVVNTELAALEPASDLADARLRVVALA